MGGFPFCATFGYLRRLLAFRTMGLIVLSYGTSTCGERTA